jgi:hypothetical protein
MGHGIERINVNCVEDGGPDVGGQVISVLIPVGSACWDNELGGRITHLLLPSTFYSPYL